MPRRLLALALLALLACGLAAAKEAAPGDQLDGGQPLGEVLPASQCQGGGGRLGGVRVRGSSAAVRARRGTLQRLSSRCRLCCGQQQRHQFFSKQTAPPAAEPWESVDLGDATLLDFELLAAGAAPAS